jgi:hypothetical protein
MKKYTESNTGGENNIYNSWASFIGGGSANCMFDSCAAIVGGQTNIINQGAPHSFIGGGNGNTVSAACSAILGGANNNVTHPSAAVFGNGVNSQAPDTFHVSCLNAVNTPNVAIGPFAPGTVFWKAGNTLTAADKVLVIQ